MSHPTIPRECECCANCTHFYQHYMMHHPGSQFLIPVNLGHCGFPRYRLRQPTCYCEHFERREEKKNNAACAHSGNRHED